MKKWKIAAGILACLVVSVMAGTAVFLAFTVSKSPSLDSVDFTPNGYLTTIVDDEGEVMTSLVGSEANRVYADLELIPEDLQEAFVAIEDARFYEHNGIDLKGILRAFWKGIKNGGNFSEGASTITQQLLKNNVFTNWTSEDTFSDRLERKIQEQWLAIQLEQSISKEEILENYLNTINLGAGTWGVQQASKRYFNKDVSDLTLSECSVIAGITKNPSAYNPIKNPDKCRERQELVLAAMLKQGYITETEYEEALADDVYTRIAESHTDATADVLSYFEDTLVLQVLDDLMEQKGYSEEQAWDLIYRGGLTIYSTQNTAYQTIVEETINNSELYSDDQVQASIVLMDVDTGEVKAIAGGRGTKEASLILNRATDSVRQPGSLVKVIGEYSAAIESGLVNLGTVIDDAEYTYSNGTSISNAEETYNGQTTVNYAITHSLNIPALKVFQSVGLDKVWEMLEDYGISTLTEADRVEALAIGGTSGGMTNLEVTAAYNTIANGGDYVKPVYYTKILDHDGNTILENVTESREVVSEDTAALLTSAMEDVIDEGTGYRANFDGMAIAGKSGTTNGYRDTWFVGYSPYVTCGVWSGYDSNDKQSNSYTVKKLWKAVMERVSDYETPVDEFASVKKLSTVTICTKCGQRAVEGLCNISEQGDMTCAERFAVGAEPIGTCTCHVSVEICSTSGMAAGYYCPTSGITTKVYLKEGTEGTADEDYVVPAETENTCTEHTSIWDKWGWHWGSGDSNGQGTDDGQNGSDNGNGNNGNGWGWGWNWGSDDSNGQGTDDNQNDSNNGNGNDNGWGWNWGSDDSNSQNNDNGYSNDHGNGNGYSDGQSDGSDNGSGGSDWWSYIFG